MIEKAFVQQCQQGMASGKISNNNWETVSLPFTATKDGILSVNITPSKAANYYYVKESSTNIIFGEGSSDGGRTSMIIPVVAGRTYSKESSSNSGTVTIRLRYFY